MGKTEASIKKMAVPAAAAFTAVTGAAVGFAKAAAEDAAGAERLAGNLQRATGATDAQVAAVEDWISAQGRALGVADDQLRPAMERLARSTGDVGEAQELAALSMDIAAATGKDVETVANAVAKANDGQMGALKKLGLTLGEQAQNTIDYNKAQQDLAKAQGDAQAALEQFGPSSKQYETAMAKVDTATASVAAITAEGVDWVGELGEQMGGAAATQADTAAGQMQRFQLALSETGEAIGGALLPVLDALLGPLQSAALFAQDNTTALTILMGVIAGLSGAILLINGAMKAYSAATTAVTTVQKLFTVSTELGTAAQGKSTAALIASKAAAAAHAVAMGVVRAATVTWTAVQWLLNAALTANPIGLVVAAIAALVAGLILAYKKSDTFREIVDKLWRLLKGSVVAAFEAVSGAISGVVGWLKQAWDWVTKLLDKIGGLASKLNPFKSAAATSASVTYYSAPTVAAATTSSSARPRVTINYYAGVLGNPARDGRLLKRILEGEDVEQGRTRGAPLAVAW